MFSYVEATTLDVNSVWTQTLSEAGVWLLLSGLDRQVVWNTKFLSAAVTAAAHIDHIEQSPRPSPEKNTQALQSYTSETVKVKKLQTSHKMQEDKTSSSDFWKLSVQPVASSLCCGDSWGEKGNAGRRMEQTSLTQTNQRTPRWQIGLDGTMKYLAEVNGGGGGGGGGR